MNARPSLTNARNFLAGEGRWREIVADAVGVLEHEAAKVGLFFQPSHEASDLDGSIAPVNPRYCSPRVSPKNFVHVMGSGGVPERLQTRQAIRLYHWYSGANLASEGRALRIYYDHPEDARHTEYAIFSQPIAERIHGRVAFNGAIWVHPELRGPLRELNGARVAQIISPLSRFLALYLYDADWCIATSKDLLVRNGTANRYGWAGVEGGVAESISSIGGAPDCALMWSRREDVIAEAARIVRDGVKPVSVP